MTQRSARKRWGILATALAILGGLAIFVVARATGGSPPEDFGSKARSAQPSKPGTLEPEDGTDATDGPDKQTTLPRKVDVPRELRIPRLKVRAPVDPVGVADDGEAEVPEDARRVGWYRFGPAPGAARGSAVIVGHVDSQTQGLGVLAELSDVSENDRVEVRGSGGADIGYRIVSRWTVPKEELAASGAFRRDGSPVLTLVTCTGAYLKDRGGYQENLVVTAVREPS